MILTAIEKVCINYGKPDQLEISELDANTARKYISEGHFAPGSMLPKIEAALKFILSKNGRRAIITSLDKAVDALNGRAGTTLRG